MATVGYVTTANFGAKVALAVAKVKEAAADLQRVKDTAFAASNSGADWTKLEGGDYGANAGQGQAYYDAVNGLVTAITTANAVAFGNQLDKGA